MPLSDMMPGALAMLKMVEMVASLVRSQTAPEPSADGPEHTPDRAPECVRENLGELICSHYPDGTVRLENRKSGVIQEEGPDGSLTLSLPHGTVLHQASEGESLLVLDPQNPDSTMLAQMGYLSLEGSRRFVYHYNHPQTGHHIIEAESLRYFKGKRPGQALLPAWQAVA